MAAREERTLEQPILGIHHATAPPENATGNWVKIFQHVPVKIVLESGQNQDHQLRPGMSV